MRLGKVTLYVNNQEDAKAFWCDKMGLTVKFEQQMGPGFTWLEVGNENEFTTLVLYSKDVMLSQNPNTNVLCPSILFSVNDVAKKYEEVKNAGVKVNELQVMPYGSMFTFYDNDDNMFVIREDK